jgi:hypothetical protein
MNILKITNPNRKWYKIVIWWEIRRIPYNILMYGIGTLSFYISFVTIPLIYLLIGLLLNIIYTFGWIVELMIRKRISINARLNYPLRTYLSYIVFSTLLIVGFALFLFICNVLK